MENYGVLVTGLTCPHCGYVGGGPVGFQWGYVPNVYQGIEAAYRMGERIRWRWCEGAGVYSWASFEGPEDLAEHRGGANLGDPSVTDLVVRDTMHFYREEGEGPPAWCPVCRRAWEGAAVEIRENVIRRAWIYEPGEFDNDADLYLIKDDGRLVVPMLEWNLPPLVTVRGCHEWRLVAPHFTDGELVIPGYSI